MIVSNSSTLILIAKATLLSKFLDSTKILVITDVVHKEITKKESFEVKIIKKEIERGRIKIEATEAKHYLGLLKQFGIDEGEASAFALCVNKKYNGILTDDRELIKLCKIEEIRFTTAMAIAVALFRRKFISKEEALEKMENLQGYGRYSKDVYNYFKSMVK